MIPFQPSETFMSEPDGTPAHPHGSRRLSPEVPFDFPDKNVCLIFFPLFTVTFRQMFDEQMVRQPAEVSACPV